MSESTEIRLLDLMSQSLEKLQKIEIGQALQSEILKNHTESDATNFEVLNHAINELKTKMETLQIERATEKGEKAAEARANKFSAVTWGGGIAALLTAIAEAIRQYLSK